MAPGMFAAGRHEDNVGAFFAQQADQVELPQRAGIAVRLRYALVQDQYLALAAVQQCRPGHGAHRQLRFQRLLPLFGKDVLIAHLIGLHPGARIGAVAGALVMHHHAGRLYQHLVTRCTDRKRQIGVFVVRRHVTPIQPAQRLQQRAWQRDGRARAVIHRPHICIARVVGRFEAAVTPGAAIAEHHAAGFLQPPVRVDQLRADQPALGCWAKVSINRSSQPGCGMVSLLSSTTKSPRASAMPSLQAAMKPPLLARR